jgi:hypothetical protein
VERFNLKYGLWVEKAPAGVQSEKELCALGSGTQVFLVTTVENLKMAVERLAGTGQ